jgi:hypothetical protein
MVVVKKMIYLGDWDNIKRNYIFKAELAIVHFFSLSLVNKCN